MTTATPQREDLDEPGQMVFDFIQAFDAKPDWIELVREEKREVEEAAAHLLKELVDLIYVLNGSQIAGHTMDELMVKVGEPSAVVVQLFEAFDADITQEAFRRVHASNMSKLDDNGKPIRRADGKVLKGPNYKPPVLDDLIADQPVSTH